MSAHASATSTATSSPSRQTHAAMGLIVAISVAAGIVVVGVGLAIIIPIFRKRAQKRRRLEVTREVITARKQQRLMHMRKTSSLLATAEPFIWPHRFEEGLQAPNRHSLHNGADTAQRHDGYPLVTTRFTKPFNLAYKNDELPQIPAPSNRSTPSINAHTPRATRPDLLPLTAASSSDSSSEDDQTSVTTPLSPSQATRSVSPSPPLPDVEFDGPSVIKDLTEYPLLQPISHNSTIQLPGKHLNTSPISPHPSPDLRQKVETFPSPPPDDDRSIQSQEDKSLRRSDTRHISELLRARARKVEPTTPEPEGTSIYSGLSFGPTIRRPNRGPEYQPERDPGESPTFFPALGQLFKEIDSQISTIRRDTMRRKPAAVPPMTPVMESNEDCFKIEHSNPLLASESAESSTFHTLPPLPPQPQTTLPQTHVYHPSLDIPPRDLDPHSQSHASQIQSPAPLDLSISSDVHPSMKMQQPLGVHPGSHSQPSWLLPARPPRALARPLQTRRASLTSTFQGPDISPPPNATTTPPPSSLSTTSLSAIVHGYSSSSNMLPSLSSNT